jgi:hypothetical protein
VRVLLATVVSDLLTVSILLFHSFVNFLLFVYNHLSFSFLSLCFQQSGGTGLNLVEANHVLFCDRWFNPFVHDQASDRVFRLGQKKDVYVNFFDCSLSIDNVMQILNTYKNQNAKVILPDGTDLGTNAGGGLTYQVC